MKKLGILLLVFALLVFAYQHFKQERPIPIVPEDEITDFERWFEQHHPACEICIPGWPPLMCEEAWEKYEKK